jgi:two-component system response regulator FixJ
MQAEPTIYVVDDDEGVRVGLAALLEVKGYAVRTFESGEALLAGLPAKPAGCAILDVRMPGMSGLDVQRELQRRNVALPVVVITGHGDIPVAVAALKSGAVDFLEKPFDGTALLAAVDEALRRSPAPPTPDQAALAARMQQLTPREREVMDLVVAGHMNKVIAHRLKIAVRTVEIHRARVMQKTGARSLSELVRMAIELDRPPPASRE